MQGEYSFKSNTPPLRLVFWETTSSCNLKCKHCRASAIEQRNKDELNYEQCRHFLYSVSSFAKPVIVLSGGEPLVREDIYDIAAYGNSLGLRMVLATNGTAITPAIAKRLVQSGIQRLSISIDGANAKTHDTFRGISGAFDSALDGLKYAQEAGLPVQINTTISQYNIKELSDIYKLAILRGACALHFFLLVPTGCGKEMPKSELISSEDYEQVLNWIYYTSKVSPIQLKATCAPHYFRVMYQNASTKMTKETSENQGFESMTRGCLAGISVCFISHKGDVYPCGYFPLRAGNIHEQPIRSIWEKSELFEQLRDYSLLKGKCGMCEFVRVCGGCRARAYAEKGDYLEEEPNCAYQPIKYRISK